MKFHYISIFNQSTNILGNLDLWVILYPEFSHFLLFGFSDMRHSLFLLSFKLSHHIVNSQIKLNSLEYQDKTIEDKRVEER